MKKKQRRNKVALFNKRVFGILLILSALVFWYVYKENTRYYVTTADSTGIFTYDVPESWLSIPYIWSSCCDGPPKTEPDWFKVTKPITLQPTSNEEAIVTIEQRPYQDYYVNTFNELKTSVKEDYFAKVVFEGKRNDGHEALFTRVDYLGPPDAKVESFTDHRYYFDNGSSFVRVEFREKYHHDWYPENDIDFSKYSADAEKIANSITFKK